MLRQFHKGGIVVMAGRVPYEEIFRNGETVGGVYRPGPLVTCKRQYFLCFRIVGAKRVCKYFQSFFVNTSRRRLSSEISYMAKGVPIDSRFEWNRPCPAIS